MRFGPVRLADAEGAILAHSHSAGGRRIKKGRPLSAEDVAALAEAGVTEVVAARLDPEDMAEDDAAAELAAALAGDPGPRGLTLSAPFTGRANLFAAEAGVLRVDAEAIAAVNAIDEAVTIATLPDFARVAPRQMVATVKIIPYAAPRRAVAEAAERLSAVMGARVSPFRPARTALILTETPGMKPALLTKGAEAVRARLDALGLTLVEERRVAHETGAVAAALAESAAELVLILTASATSDRRDVAPAAVEAAGGRLERFGMPVDPGNLLFLGEIGGRRVIGLPGCARSPALNGADWVLERVAAALPVTGADIGAMGVGGLLKEIPSRPEPRAGGASAPQRPHVTAAVLAAGASRRMGGRDKLLEPVEGAPVLARVARAALESRADETLVVLPPHGEARRAALDGLDGARIVENRLAAEGMAASIRAATAAAAAQTDALILLLADMPEVSAAHLDALIAAYDPEEGRAICRASDGQGRPGHPVLIGRRFFEALGRLEGDAGAKALLEAHGDLVETVPTPGLAATTDLDTPEAWAAWREARGAEG